MTTMTDANVLPLDDLGPSPNPTPAPAPAVLDPVDILARNPATALDQIDREAAPATLARGWVVTILVCAGAFGATLGFFRGAQQAVYAAVKLPLVILLTAAVLAPALTCLNAALQRPADLRKDLLLVMACLARASLVLSAEIPILWLGLSLDASYHTMVLAAVAACAVAGAAALWLLVRGLLRFRRGAIVTAVLLVSAFMVVGAQMAWVLRPYLARPRDANPPFLRSLDGSFIESVVTSSDSARGIYRNPAGVRR